MRLFLTPIISLSLLAGLAACASGASGSRYSDDLRQLEADCRARGGVLVPSGYLTGRPQTDNVCKISGPATRLPDR